MTSVVRVRPAAAISGRQDDEAVPVVGPLSPPESRACPAGAEWSAGCRGGAGTGSVGGCTGAADDLVTPDSPGAGAKAGGGDSGPSGADARGVKGARGVSGWCGAG